MRTRTTWLVGAAVAAAALTGRAQDEDPPDAPEPETPLARVVAVLRAEDDAAFEGVTVIAYGAPGGTQTKTTGKDGTVRFDAMPREGVTFVARHEGRYPAWHAPGQWWWRMPEEDLDPDGDGVTTMTLSLFAGEKLEGRVVAKEGTAPVAGATIEAHEDPQGTDQVYLQVAPIWTAVTDADGRFRTSSATPKLWRKRAVTVKITARAPGFISETIEGEMSPVTFGLLGAATLSGAVAGADGKPAAGVDVHAYPSDFGTFSKGPQETVRWDEDEHPRVRHVKTGDDGRYAIPELHPGVKFFVYAERLAVPAGADSSREQPVERSVVAAGVTVAGAGGAAVCDLKLRALSSLTVELATDLGPDTSANFTLDLPPGARPWSVDEGQERGWCWRGLEPGRYVLRVSAAEWAPLTKTIDVAAGQDVKETVNLERGATVEGVVVDDLGTPVAGIRVYAHPVDTADPSGRNDQDVETDASGVFRIGALPAGPVNLDVAGGGYVFGSKVRATAPAADVKIIVVREPRIRIRVDAPPGEPLPEKVAAVVVDATGHYAGMRDEREIPSADFPAILDSLRPGPVDVTVDIPGHAPATLRVVLKPGETADLGPFKFEDGADLTGRVVDGEGRPVAGARITPYEHASRMVTTGADGEFVLPHLAAGTVDLAVGADGFPETRLDAKTGSKCAVVLRPGGTVRATVTSKGNDRIDQRRFCIFAASAPNGSVPHWHPELGKDGTFRLPAGKYRFVPSRYEFEKDTVVFDVAEGGETEVEFVVQ